MEMCKWTYHLNNIIPTEHAQLPVTSHIINFGTGAFESLRCYRNNDGIYVKGLDRHVERFRNSLIAINLTEISKNDITNALAVYIAKNNIHHAYIRILGYPNGFCDVIDTINFKTEFSIFGWHTAQTREYNAIALNIGHLRRSNPAATLSRGKICGLYVIDSVVQNNAILSGFDTGLLLNEDGTICEAAGANIFVFKNDKLITPPVSNSIKGITAEITMEIAKYLQIPVEVMPIVVEDLMFAEEAFITGTFYGIRPIRQIDKFALKAPKGEITQRLIQAYEEIITNESPLSEKWMQKIELLDSPLFNYI